MHGAGLVIRQHCANLFEPRCFGARLILGICMWHQVYCVDRAILVPVLGVRLQMVKGLA